MGMSVLKSWIKSIVLLVALFGVSSVFADGTVSAAQTAQNLEQNITSLAGIAGTVSVIMGIGLILGSFFRFKLYGQMRGNFMSYQMTLSGPLIMFLSGSMLLALPTMLRSSLLAFWGSSNPLAYSSESSGGWSVFVPVVIDFVRFVGICAFIRGIVLLSKAGGGTQAKPGATSKALLHMLGGVLCINVVATHALLATLLPI